MWYPDVAAIREDIAAQLVAAGIRAYPYEPDKGVNPPCVIVRTPALQRSTFQGGAWEIQFPLEIVTGTAWDRASQRKSDELVPDVWEAVEAATYTAWNGSIAVGPSLSPTGEGVMLGCSVTASPPTT